MEAMHSVLGYLRFTFWYEPTYFVAEDNLWEVALRVGGPSA